MAEADRMATEARMAAGSLVPLKRGGYEESAGLVRFNGPVIWSLAQDTPKLRQFFTARFGRALPVSAFGQTQLHDRWGAIPGSASDAHIHVGQPSPRLTARR
jgi:hypothetical protein